MKISLDALQALEAIDRCGTFALAAKELNRVPSALTYMIHHIETQLEVMVFDRTGYRAKLTPVGRQILEEGRKLLLAADQFEKNIKLFQSGLEDKITIAYDRIIPFNNFLFLIEDFCEKYPEVELKWSGEVLGGCWDALASKRAMLAIGVTSELPIREDVALSELGEVEFVFVMSPLHPLSQISGLIANDKIIQNRMIVVADSSRHFIPRSSRILPGQEILTVSTFEEKLAIILAGLGIGYLPYPVAWPYIRSGELVVKEVDRLAPKAILSTAWRPSIMGKGLKWFIDKLSDKKIRKKILLNNKQ